MNTIISKPWGEFEQFTLNEKTTVKILRVKPHSSLSLQRHKKRREFWYVLKGSGYVHLGPHHSHICFSKPGVTFNIPPGAEHRLTAEEDAVEVLEISYGHFDENDIERLEDNYNRVTKLVPKPKDSTRNKTPKLIKKRKRSKPLRWLW